MLELRTDRHHTIYFIALTIAVLVFFMVDLSVGSVDLRLHDLFRYLSGGGESEVGRDILLNFRLPKAITAVLAGSSLAVAGLMMQTFFRNPLAEPYILGVSSGAGMGVALVMMSASVFPLLSIYTGLSTVIAAVCGSTVIMLLVIALAAKVKNAVSLLVVGLMIGMLVNSVVGVLQNFSSAESVKSYLLWTFGSLTAVSWNYMAYMLPICMIGLGLAFYLHKRLDGLLLGENYARSMGINLSSTRLMIIIATGLLAGGVTAFTGPIAFVGVAIPHIARGVFKTPRHKKLIPASVLSGSILMLLCDIVSQLPTYVLPINTVSALFGAPVIIWIIIKRR